jgi:hypothetical protein
MLKEFVEYFLWARNWLVLCMYYLSEFWQQPYPVDPIMLLFDGEKSDAQK